MNNNNNMQLNVDEDNLSDNSYNPSAMPNLGGDELESNLNNEFETEDEHVDSAHPDDSI